MDWINCDKVLPQQKVRVLVSTKYGEVRIADYKTFKNNRTPYWRTHSSFGVVRYELDEVTHWAPLPDPATKGE